MNARQLALLATITLVASIAPRHGAAAPSTTATARRQLPAAVYTTWIRLDPSQPHTILAGGMFGCTATVGSVACARRAAGSGQPITCLAGFSDGCQNWLARSLDGGRTWTRLERALGIAAALHCSKSLLPLVVGRGLDTMLALVNTNCGSPNSTTTDLLYSPDGGLHWRQSIQGSPYGGGVKALAISPVASNRAYAAVYAGGSPGDYRFEASDDGGRNWPVQSNPVPPGPADGTVYLVRQIVPDRYLPSVVYVNLGASGSNAPIRPVVIRSIDGGHTWASVVPPAALSPTAAFSVDFDPHLYGLLVGRSGDPTLPPGRVFVSADQGATWQTADCPGVLHGHCPLWTVDNVFGAGASYAILPTGIYPFHAGGPSGTRLATGAALPAPVAHIVDLAAGMRAGDPIYVLAKPAASRMSNVLYESLDAGRHWSVVPVAPLPNAQPAATAPGTLLVMATHHSVAAPFVSAYRHLGLLIAGYPLTEAYMDGDTLVQVFQHLRLELHGARVVVGSLGSDEFEAHIALGDAALSTYLYGGGAVSPVPDTTAQQYFPTTRHTISGDLLRFWRAHGGLGVLGTPLTQVVRGINGDGSGRVYEMQYFSKVRLERHPENANPRYKILLGLLGSEWLGHQGWVLNMSPETS